MGVNAPRSMILSTALNTTSGVQFDYLNIPAWAKRITLLMNGIGTNGTNRPIIQLGTSAGIDATGYAGSMVQTASALATDTNGASLNPSWASTVRQSGVITISLMGSNTWVFSGVMGRSDAAAAIFLGVVKTLTGTLDRLRITTNTGTDAFTAGSVNILIEG